MVSFLVDAVLFDMDGTLVDSTPGVIKAWHSFATDEKYEHLQLDVPKVLQGRSILTPVLKLPMGSDWSKAFIGGLISQILMNCKLTQAESKRFEEEVIVGGPVILPGVELLLQQLAGLSNAEVDPKWTIVTSSTSFYAPQALKAAGILMPPSIVTSEDVARGKPAPDPYLEGAKRCNVDPTRTLVVEDAPSGIRSGRAAGAKTLAVLTSHTEEEMLASGAEPDYIVRDLSHVSARWTDGKIQITISS